MKKDETILLEDIVEAAKKIGRFCRGLDGSDFYNNDLVKSAVARQFEILGEAINHLSDKTKEKYSDIDWTKPVSFRNILIHGYQDIDYKIVWDTIKSDLPGLKQKIKKILKEL